MWIPTGGRMDRKTGKITTWGEDGSEEAFLRMLLALARLGAAGADKPQPRLRKKKKRTKKEGE